MPLYTRPDWATDATYSDPGQPWDATATKVVPAAGYISQGNKPKAGLVAQYYNEFLNRAGKWVEAILDGASTIKQLVLDGAGSVAAPAITAYTAQGYALGNGNAVRGIFADHLGMPSPNFLLQVQEDWWGINSAANASATGALPSPADRWTLTSVGTGAFFADNTLSAAYPTVYVRLHSTDTNNSVASLATSSFIFSALAGTVAAVAEIEVGLKDTNHGNNTIWVGFADAGQFDLANQYIWFKSVGGGNYFCQTFDNSGSPHSTDSGVAPTRGDVPLDRLRIEIVDNGGGMQARFFINDVHISAADTTAHIPTDGLFLGAEIKATVVTSNCNLYLGQIRATLPRAGRAAAI